jgi:hypothetical protein
VLCLKEQEGSLKERKPADIKAALAASYESEHGDEEPEDHRLEVSNSSTLNSAARRSVLSLTRCSHS